MPTYPYDSLVCIEPPTDDAPMLGTSRTENGTRVGIEVNAILALDGKSIAHRTPPTYEEFELEHTRPATLEECILLFGTIGGSHTFHMAEERKERA